MKLLIVNLCVSPTFPPSVVSFKKKLLEVIYIK